MLSCTFFLLLCAGSVPREVLDLCYSGFILGDRHKVQSAWEQAQTPQIASALTEVWPFESGVAADEEIVGTPPFLTICRKWAELEPDNAAPDCLREVFSAARERRLPQWEALQNATEGKRRIYFHYEALRRGTLQFLLKRKGNSFITWIYWLGRSPVQNAERVSGLIQTGLLEARFHTLVGSLKKAERLIEILSDLISKMELEGGDISLRVLSLRQALLQQKILYCLVAGKASEVAPLLKEYKKTREKIRRVLGRLLVLSRLNDSFIRAFRISYREVREPEWSDLLSADAATMAVFAELFLSDGDEAVSSLWKYRLPNLPDSFEGLEKNLDLFTEGKIQRAQAARFMDFLKKRVEGPEGIPVWAIPAYEKVVKVYRNAVALGKERLKVKEKERFAWITGALNFYAGLDKDSEKWIQAFREGKVSTYLLFAFARHNLKEAVLPVIERFKEVAAEGRGEPILDYVLCLEKLTGKSLGTDPRRWESFFQKQRSF